MRTIRLAANTSWNVCNLRRNLVGKLIDSGYRLVAAAPPDDYSMPVLDLGARCNGCRATGLDAWPEALHTHCSDPNLRTRFGEVGRAPVEAKVSLIVTAPRLCGLLRETTAAGSRT